MTRDPLNIGVRLTPELHAALSAEVARRSAADPDAGWTLSSVARSILRGALLGRAAVPPDACAELPRAPAASQPTASPTARAELQPVEAPPAVVARTTADNAAPAGALDARREPPETATPNTRAEVDTATVQTSPVDLALAPPPGPRIAPDEVQDAARAEVLAWVAVDPKHRTRSSLAAVSGANTSNVLRWLAPGVRQRLPAVHINAILAFVRANP